MKLFVRRTDQVEYHRQYSYPSIPAKSEIKPGDTLYSLWADYHIDKVEYSKTDVTVYATKTQIVTERRYWIWHMTESHHVSFMYVKANVLKAENQITVVIARSVISMNRDARLRELTERRKNWRRYDWENGEWS